MLICPFHRAALGIDWRRGTTRCRVPGMLSKHSSDTRKRPKADRGLSRADSQIVLKEAGIFLAVGTGVCRECRKILSAMTTETVPKTLPDDSDTEIAFKMNAMSLEQRSPSTSTALIDHSTPCTSLFDITPDPSRSVYSPSDTDESVTTMKKREPLSLMNSYLESRDVSPVRYPVNTLWAEASTRTRRRHLRKARQAVAVVLDEIAPSQAGDLWGSLVASKSLEQHFSDGSESDHDEDVDDVLMEALTECYNNANSWQTRRQILSVMADKVSYKTLVKWIPNLTRYRFSSARKHILAHGRGVPPPEHLNRKMFVSQTQLDHFLDFITSPHVIQDLPFGDRCIKLSTKEVITVPNVVRMLIPESIVKQYLAYTEECGFNPLSRSTLLRILSSCSASVRKSLQGLDYISFAGAQAFDDLCHVAERLGDEVMGMTWAKEKRERLKSGKRYLKSDFKVHVQKQSTIPDHCRTYALSDPKDEDYQSICEHDHLDICDRCASLASVLKDIEDAVEKMSEKNINAEVREELAFLAVQAKTSILAWKAHLLRCVNQDDARLDVLETLDETSALLVQDWAMKFLPRKFRESQSDWFGKRGISWHITVATTKNENDFQMITFVNIFESCSQDSSAVLSVMKDVIGKLKRVLPRLQSVYYRQDNAGCYRSGTTIAAATLACQCHGVSLERMDFYDPHGGKAACDRKAATIKSHMRVHLNEGHNIETAKDMLDAIKSSGGVPGVVATLSGPLVNPNPSLKVSIEGVSTIANVQYNADGLTVWKAYGIGPGKTVPSTRLNLSKDTQITDVGEDAEGANAAQFTTIRSSKKTEIKHTATEPLAEKTSLPDCAVSALFPCTEEGCTKTFQRFSSLQNHLDCGRHERALESETLLDKAVLGYSERLEEQFGGVPQMQLFQSRRNPLGNPSLPMGWALRSSQGTAAKIRFSKKQKDYLIEKFRIGDSTGQKANALSVSKAMMSARDDSGSRLFSSTEFLTAQQISSFFSRLASKRCLQSQATAADSNIDDTNDLESQFRENERAFSDLRAAVIKETQPSHPICYDSYNLCELAATSKLSKFAIPMLQRICEHFDIPTTDIQSKRRKAPYIDRLMALCKKCTCQD